MAGRTLDIRGASNGRRRQIRVSVLALVAATFVVAGCSSGRVVNTDDSPAATPTSTTGAPTTPPRTNNDQLANAFTYYAESQGRAGYFFTSPSKRWVCAIFPRESAGCQSATGSTIAITGAPKTVPDAQGEDTTPSAIEVGRSFDPRFAALDPPAYDLDPGPAVELPFNEVLIVAGFECNVQEATGISCLSELTGKGFTFSSDSYAFQYTDLPV